MKSYLRYPVHLHESSGQTHSEKEKPENLPVWNEQHNIRLCMCDDDWSILYLNR